MARGVLLVNLGSPDSPEPRDVRAYLAEFLDDPRVIDLASPLRWLLLNLIVLPSRPRRSAAAYKQIWTDQGSPLVVISAQQAALLQKRIDLRVEVAMRYGRPDIGGALSRLYGGGVRDLLVVPMYPHYAMSSYETVLAKVNEEAGRFADLAIQFVQPFYDHPGFIDALVQAARPALDSKPDLVLFSYHGIPERHVRKNDPTSCWCLEARDCCARPSPSHRTCYRHQVFETTRAFAGRAGLAPQQWSVSFQSRLGRTPWLRPFSDVVIEELPKQGVKRLVVLCPSFVADCLETLEEMGIRGRAAFMAAGGESFTLVPCVNTESAWIDTLQGFVEEWTQAPARG